MSSYSKKYKNILGVDFGSRAIKLVQINHDSGQPTLATYGVANMDASSLSADISKNQTVYGQTLSNLVAQAHVSTEYTIGALPAVSAFTTVMDLPTMSKKELDSAIHWEAKKLIPLPLDKMSLDWHMVATLPDPENTGKTVMRIIATAATKDIINNSLTIFKQANLKLIGLETEISALMRALINRNDPTTMIMDIGATNTNIAIFEQGIPVITRNIDIGGRTIDLNISNSMNVNIERAQQFKNSFGPTMPGAGPEHPVSKAIKFSLDNMVLREIRPLLSAFQSAHKSSVQKIILAGGAAHLKNLPEYLSQALGIPTVIGNSWARVSYPQELSDQLMAIGPEIAVAIGLALQHG
jgi:type IV pilus assembly protein PilM